MNAASLTLPLLDCHKDFKALDLTGLSSAYYCVLYMFILTAPACLATYLLRVFLLPSVVDFVCTG